MECKMQFPMSEEEKATIKKLLGEAKTIAVVGLSPDEDRDSNRVAKYLIAVGYEVIPVYPKEEMILGQKVYRSLAEIDRPVDVVNIFRKADALAAIADEALKINPKLIWAQIGCYDDAAEAKVREAGVPIVTHRCLMVEHRKLLG
ncbi:MAG: CoA-binding protein [Campylobacterales bacterium]